MTREMKDSGVEWIGYIPCSWGTLPIHSAFVERREKVSDIEWEPLSVTKSGVVKQLEHAAKSDNHNDRKKVCIGDFAINSRSDRKESCGLSSMNGSVSLINTVLIANASLYSSKYVKYLLKNYGFAEEFYRWGTGIVADLWSTNFERMKNIKLPFPPLSEQQKIADFLDEKVKEIDNAIEKTKETIELYKSFANSMLTEFVTGKNLKSPKVKYDNMNYLGEVPKSWGKTKLKTIFRFVSVKNHPNSEVLSLYRDYGVIPKSSRDDNHNVTSLNLDSYKFVKKGNLVINKMKAWQGSLAISNYEGIVSPAYHVFEFKTNDVNKMYIHYLIRSKQYAEEFERLSTGMRIGQWDLSKEDFLNTSIIIPDIKTQQEIVEKIEKNMNNIFVLINKKNKLIDDLENYKKSLIYEYVTGKKEVK